MQVGYVTDHDEWEFVCGYATYRMVPLSVTLNGSIYTVEYRACMCKFLLAFHCNYVSISYRF